MPNERTALDAALFAVLPLSLIVCAITLWRVPDVTPDVVTSLLAALTVINLAAGVGVQARRQGRMDEVQVAATRFGALWGPIAVAIFIFLVVFVPPAQSAVAGFGAWYEARYEDPGTSGVSPAVAQFAFGAVAALFVQLAAQSALRATWMWSKR
jgi:hypothetical protein